MRLSVTSCNSLGVCFKCIILYYHIGKILIPSLIIHTTFKTLHLTTPQSHIPLLCNNTCSILVLFSSWLELPRNPPETALKLKSRADSACRPLSELARATKRWVAKRQAAKRQVAKRWVVKRLEPACGSPQLEGLEPCLPLVLHYSIQLGSASFLIYYFSPFLFFFYPSTHSSLSTILPITSFIILNTSFFSSPTSLPWTQLCYCLHISFPFSALTNPLTDLRAPSLLPPLSRYPPSIPTTTPSPPSPPPPPFYPIHSSFHHLTSPHILILPTPSSQISSPPLTPSHLSLLYSLLHIQSPILFLSTFYTLWYQSL